MSSINIGIIGFGVMGKIRFDTIKSIGGNYRVASVCDISPKNDKHLKNVKFTTDYNNILQDKDIKAVFVCTPKLYRDLCSTG